MTLHSSLNLQKGGWNGKGNKRQSEIRGSSEQGDSRIRIQHYSATEIINPGLLVAAGSEISLYYYTDHCKNEKSIQFLGLLPNYCGVSYIYGKSTRRKMQIFYFKITLIGWS